MSEDMKRVVTEQRLGFAATVCPDGSPNLSPKGTTAVWDDDRLVFADLRSPRTIENLEADPRIEINVVDPVARKGYRFKGSAAVLRDGELFEEAVERYRKQGVRHPERIKAIALIEVKRAQPLISPAYDDDRAEGDVRGEWLQRWRDLYGV